MITDEQVAQPPPFATIEKNRPWLSYGRRLRTKRAQHDRAVRPEIRRKPVVGRGALSNLCRLKASSIVEW